MSSQTILIEPELTHEFNLIRRHRTLRIGRMIYPSRRLCRQSISPQIRGDNGEPLGQMRGDFAPHDVRLWGAVEKEKRRAIPTNDSVYRGPKAVNRMGSESRKEGRRLGLNRLQLILQEPVSRLFAAQLWLPVVSPPGAGAPADRVWRSVLRLGRG